jgi:predicted flap endonuclease-1-like 5' DNA nuclease
MSTSTLVIIGAAVVLLLLVLVILARTGRKAPQAPLDADGIAMVRAATAFTPAVPDEPVPELDAVLAAELATALRPQIAEPAGPADPLTRMKGLGPKAEAVLNGLGVTRYDQIAAWSDADIARIDPQMGAFRGRIARDRWVEQANLLAKGDVPAFEAVFGKLG